MNIGSECFCDLSPTEILKFQYSGSNIVVYFEGHKNLSTNVDTSISCNCTLKVCVCMEVMFSKYP